MSIRNSAKAIVLSDGKILLNKCISRFGEYYAFPGGGQNEGETLMEAVKREVFEETGYRVKPVHLSGIYERISVRAGQDVDETCHKLYFVFFCTLEDAVPAPPSEHDSYQLGAEWVQMKDIPTGCVFPHAIRDNLGVLISTPDTIYIGSEKENQ